MNGIEHNSRYLTVICLPSGHYFHNVNYDHHHHHYYHHHYHGLVTQIMGAHQLSCCPRIDALQVFAKPLADLVRHPPGGSRTPIAGPLLPALSMLVPCPPPSHDSCMSDAATAAILVDMLLATWNSEAVCQSITFPTPQQLVAAAPPPALSMALAAALRVEYTESTGLMVASDAAKRGAVLHRAVVAALQVAPGNVGGQWDAWAWLHVWLQVLMAVWLRGVQMVIG